MRRMFLDLLPAWLMDSRDLILNCRTGCNPLPCLRSCKTRWEVIALLGKSFDAGIGWIACICKVSTIEWLWTWKDQNSLDQLGDHHASMAEHRLELWMLGSFGEQKTVRIVLPPMRLEFILALSQLTLRMHILPEQRPHAFLALYPSNPFNFLTQPDSHPLNEHFRIFLI